MKKLTAFLTGLAAFLASVPAAATVRFFDFTHYSTGFAGSLGEVKVDDFGSSGKVTVTVTLQKDADTVGGVSETFFQLPGDGFWWDLNNGADAGLDFTGAPGAPDKSTIDTPSGGAASGGAVFAFQPYSASGGYRNGNGFLSGFHYDISFTDDDGGKSYSPGPLVFTLYGAGLTAASFTGQSETNGGGVTKTVFFGADLRQCDSLSPTGGSCTTGPAGAVERIVRLPPTDVPGVPEPASWAMMIAGFGGVGALLRRRRMVVA